MEVKIAMGEGYSVSSERATPSASWRNAAPAGWRVYPVYGVDDDGICLCREAAGCPHPGKHPTPPNGFNDASADPMEIARTFARWPGENVGLATGVGSGVVALDFDEVACGGAMRRLQAGGGRLPDTRTHRSGSGSLHFLYAVPDGLDRLPSRTFDGYGLEIKGDGTGLVLPPSVTSWGPYEVLDDRPLAPLPDWLVRLAASPLVVHEGGGEKATESRYRLPEVVREGTRAITLYRYGCSLRVHGHDHAAILEQLRRTNAGRCVPPLEGAEVRKAARSAARHEKGNARTVTPGALAALGEIEADVMARAWPGTGGKTERSVMISLILTARLHGSLIPAGVRVGVSTRALAEVAGMPQPSLMRAVSRLRRSGLIRRDDLDRRAQQAGAFVLVGPGRANRYHSATPPERLRGTERVSDDTLRAPRLRWGYSLGKGCEQALDALQRAGEEMELAELAAAVGAKRTRDFRRRTVARLEAANVVEVDGDKVRLASGWLEALDRERTMSGEKKAANLDRAEHERQREAFRTWTAEREERR